MNRGEEREPERINFARSQRKQANEFSIVVWNMVRAGRMLGAKFRREYPAGPYTIDFVCLEVLLDIEVDGQDHLTEEGRTRDSKRDAYLRRLGFTVLRITGYRIINDPAAVRIEIENTLRELQRKNSSGNG